MTRISYHASHEQFSPGDLLTYVKLAEKAGFNACHSSDHFHPWSERQGHSGYAFSWLGAAMEATQFPLSIITAPGQRYHPAIVAQAIATLSQMYPGRLEVSLGSGEALNELITGEPWPEKSIRNKRLFECADIIRRLLAGETVNHSGLVKVCNAKLYTLPPQVPALMCAALTKETAFWAGSWADGLLTVWRPEAELKKIIEAFYAGGGTNKPIHVKLTFSYGRSQPFAQNEAYHQWRFNCIETTKLANLSTVEEFDKAAEAISMEQLLSSLPVSKDPKLFVELIKKMMVLDIENIVLHNVGRNQEEFITDFGAQVIPALAGG